MDSNLFHSHCPCGDKSRNEHLVSCKICTRNWHMRCAKQQGIDESKFECPICILKDQDPLHQVLDKLVGANFLSNGKKYDFRLGPDALENLKKNHSLFIEVRILKLDGVSTYETTWPDKGTLRFNDQIMKEFKPLAVNSSIKKRKDEKLTFRDYWKQQPFAENTLQIFYENVQDNKNTKTGEDPKYFFGVYLIQKLSVQELYNKIVRERTLTE